MGKWIEGLKNIENTPGKAPTKPTKPSSVGFVGASGRGFREKKPLSKFADEQTDNIEDAVESLRQAVKRAHCWDDFDPVRARTQAAYERGEIDEETAEGIAAMIAQEAQILPEDYA